MRAFSTLGAPSYIQVGIAISGEMREISGPPRPDVEDDLQHPDPQHQGGADRHGELLPSRRYFERGRDTMKAGFKHLNAVVDDERDDDHRHDLRQDDHRDAP